MPVAVMSEPRSANSESGPILPRVEWATKAGRLFRVERFQDATGGWDSRKHDITTVEAVTKDGETVLKKPAMLFDFASGANCWVRFTPFDEIVVALDGILPPRPAAQRDERGEPLKDRFGKPIQHAQMLRVPVYSPMVFGKDNALHELSAKGDNVVRAVAELFDQVEQSAEYAAGKLPLVEWSGHTTTGKNNDLFVPTFKILGWHDRPAAVAKIDRPKRVEGSAPAKTAAPQHEPRGGGAIDDEIPFGPEVR
jgi:hypothetical protein